MYLMTEMMENYGRIITVSNNCSIKWKCVRDKSEAVNLKIQKEIIFNSEHCTAMLEYVHKRSLSNIASFQYIYAKFVC